MFYPSTRILVTSIGMVCSITSYATDNFYNMKLGESGLYLAPVIDVTLSHNDNIFLKEEGIEKKSSNITVIAPSLTLYSEKDNDRYELRYSGSFGLYHDSSDDNYSDHSLEFNASKAINKRNRLDINLASKMLHEARGTGISDGTGVFFTEPDEYTDNSINGKYTYGVSGAKMNLELSAGYLDKEYTNHRNLTSNYDYDEPKLGMIFYYRVMPKTRLLTQLNYKQINYGNAATGLDKADSNEKNYQLGITWEATAKTTGIIKAGRLTKDFDASSFDDESFNSWEVAINWAPRAKTEINLVSSSTAAESKGTGSFSQSKLYQASWKQQWNTKVASTFSYMNTKTNYIANPREDDSNKFDLRLDYSFQPEINVGLSYSNDERESTQANSDYENDIIMLNLRVGI